MTGCFEGGTPDFTESRIPVVSGFVVSNFLQSLARRCLRGATTLNLESGEDITFFAFSDKSGFLALTRY